jgi:UDP-3-O-[3-hydroxymyristoyl] glucosamine N-acyltransferase
MASTLSKIIVGNGAELDWALREWGEQEAQAALIPLRLSEADASAFAATTVAAYDPAGVTAFVAMNETRLHLHRRHVFTVLRDAGFRMPALVDRHAMIAASCVPPDNAWLRKACVIGADVILGADCQIGFGCHIEPGCRIGSHVLLRENTKLGRNCVIETRCTLGPHITVADNTHVGEGSRLTKAGTYQGAYTAGSFHEERFTARIV